MAQQTGYYLSSERTDGASAIDLVDGEQFLDKLKELELGITTQKIE